MGHQLHIHHAEIVTFEGEPPEAGEIKEPLEIIAWADASEPHVVYRRGVGQVTRLYTGDPDTGHAIEIMTEVMHGHDESI